jgi:cobalt/nickel transport system permease protein
VSGIHGGVGQDIESVAARDSPVHRLDPRVKIAGLIGLTVVAVTLPVGAWAALGVVLAVLVALAAVARLPARHVLRRMNVELPFLLSAAVLPFTADDGLRLAGTVAGKITIGVLAMIVLSSTTPFPMLLRGFELLRAPRLLVAIVAFMWRYLHVLGEEVTRMKVAREARGYSAGWLWQATSTGPLIASLFLRALERGERVYLAMLSRGYTGGVPEGLGLSLTLRRADVAFVAGMAVLLATVRIGLP